MDPRRVDAGLQVLWAANRWPAAVEWHTKNNPDKNHSETKKAYAVKRKPLIFMVPKPGSNIPPTGRYFTGFTYYQYQHLYLNVYLKREVP